MSRPSVTSLHDRLQTAELNLSQLRRQIDATQPMDDRLRELERQVSQLLSQDDQHTADMQGLAAELAEIRAEWDAPATKGECIAAALEIISILLLDLLRLLWLRAREIKKPDMADALARIGETIKINLAEQIAQIGATQKPDTDEPTH